tara:strand:- start:26 stop:193 length:168 start_codon:yes stop_codon:yes gene_type:complete
MQVRQELVIFQMVMELEVELQELILVAEEAQQDIMVHQVFNLDRLDRLGEMVDQV